MILGSQAAFGENFVHGGERIFAAFCNIGGQTIESRFATRCVEDAVE